MTFSSSRVSGERKQDKKHVSPIPGCRKQIHVAAWVQIRIDDGAAAHRGQHRAQDRAGAGASGRAGKAGDEGSSRLARAASAAEVQRA